ncbi:DUF4349 domain-containing protein [Kitasatospora sp. NPDC049258]|uniref:DUF4349 domain-containing protein n=1 Tax=Kitasatospora sp. NPDC049258 TaxID=3155394 RepID=UPI0034462622
MAERRVVVALGVAAVLLLSGCGAGSGGSSASAGDQAAAPAAVAEGGKPAVADGKAPADGKAAPGGGAAQPAAQPSAAPAPAPDPRYIEYKAQLSLEVKEIDKAVTAATEAAQAAGGYLANQNVSGKDAQLTLKVPSSGHQRALDQLAALGTRTLRLTSQADDLTQQVVDVDSRVKTQQASVDRVRALMADAKTLAEVVSLESELSRREADLESLKSQQQALSARTSFSTITLELHAERTAEPAPAKPRKDGLWASVGHAAGGGWHVLVAIVQGLLVALAALAPFLLVLVPAGLLLWWPRRRRRRAGNPAGAEAEAGAVPAQPTAPPEPQAAPAPPQ